MAKKEKKVKEKITYSKGSIVRSLILMLVSFAVTIATFIGYMIYGGNGADPEANGGMVSQTELYPKSMIYSITVDDDDTVYVLYKHTMQLNAYDGATGDFLFSASLPESTNAGDSGLIYYEDVNDKGEQVKKIYAITNSGNVYTYDNRKFAGMVRWDEEKKAKMNKLLDETDTSEFTTADGTVYKNQYFQVSRKTASGEKSTLSNRSIFILYYSPLSLLLMIIGIVCSVIFTMQYNKKVNA